jgi:RNA-dependent RNA polymerase
MREIFKDYNITVKIGSHFTESPHRPVPVWQWIDFSESGSQRNSALLQDLGNETYEHLPFEVRYQLEVCLSQGYLSEYTMTRDFIRELKARGDVQGRRLLEFVATEKRKYLDPMRIFDFQFLKGVTDSKIPSYCCYMHTARVTPTTIYYNTPSVDISNRVVRGWSSNHSAGRFLRVRFTDEKTEGRINSSIGNSNDEVYTRVKRTLANGITIGSRHYEFLAFGNSQFREHGAYFFSSDAGVSAATIRAWMGQFNHIRNVAKYAARLGQSFSTTRAFTSSSVQAVVRNDIGRNGFTFSDGVGKISKFLAQLITEEHKIRTSTGDPPSAYQFRLGGSKGILVVSPDPLPKEVHIRPSQYKFEAKHQGLEIIRWSQFSLATLNRQLILVLTALGIPDHVFHAKQNAMLNSFYEAMSSDAKVTELLQKYIDPSQTTLILAKMVNDGFRRSNEPFMNTMLGLWKAWHLKHLKEKAKIVIDGGANLLGCIDETATLKGYFKNTIPANGSYEEKLAALPEIFVQVCRPEADGRYEIIKGVCILARNPSLHPGDIRVVRAVDRPELRDLRDVVVLPQTGDQDVASMCSGGDLDGDDYLVIWDPDLIPTDWFTESMDYKSNKAPDLNHDVTVDEVTSFFVTYMKNDCLPKIAHAHMAWADRLTDGVRSEKCMRLAKLHSDAVDYNKTGGHAVMRRDLTPTLWPHFMEKRFKRKECIYHSRRILGQLYDNVIAPDFVPNLAMPFDSRILNGSLAAASELYMNFARALKVEWDMNMRQVMAQYEISTEFEVWSAFVLRHGFVLKDFKMQEDLGNIVGNMRRGFRQACYDKAGADHIASLVVAMYRVTEEQMTAAIEAQKEEKRLREDLSIVDIPSTELPFITFPWIFPEVLGEIAMGKRQASGAGTSGVHDPSSTEKKPIFDWTQVQKIVEGMQDNVTTKLIVDQVSDSTMLNEEIGSGHRHKSSEDRDSGVWLDEDDNEDDEDGGVRLTSNDKDEDFSFEPVEPVGPVADEKMEIKEKIAGDDELDIVEKEGDVKPSALDTLISMINT